MTPAVRLTAAVLGTPDPRGLARFSQQLLGRPIRDDTDDRATLRPQEPGVQQMQQHLDVEVDDLTTACTHAESIGARRLGGHSDADEAVAVHADPAGHPFCLFVAFG